VAAGQSFDPGEQRLLRHLNSLDEPAHEGAFRWRGGGLEQRQQLAHVRCEHQRAGAAAIEEASSAELVDREDAIASAPIPDDECERAPKPREHLRVQTRVGDGSEDVLGGVRRKGKLARDGRPVVDHAGDGRQDAVVEAAVRAAVLEPQFRVCERLGASAVCSERAVEPVLPCRGSQLEKVKSRFGVLTGNAASVKSPSVEPAVTSMRSP